MAIFTSSFIILVGLGMLLNIKRVSTIIENTEDEKIIEDLKERKQKMLIVFKALLLLSVVYFTYLTISLGIAP